MISALYLSTSEPVTLPVEELEEVKLFEEELG